MIPMTKAINERFLRKLSGSRPLSGDWALTPAFSPCYQKRPAVFPVLMPSFALLLRCFLIVTLCLDGSLSLWSSSVMAVNETSRAGVDVATLVVAEAGDADCNEAGTPDRPGAAHEDCDCTASSCGCLCLFPVAAITHAVPFKAQYALAAQPAVRSEPHMPLNARTAVFRPPIG